MADSIRQEIMDALVTQLGLISTTGGYNTTPTIYKWREYALEDSDYPAIILRDTTNDYEIHHAEWLHTLRIDIGIMVQGEAADDTMRSVIADVIVALGADTSIGGYVYDLEIDNDTQEIEHEGYIQDGCLMHLVCRYKTPAWDPYTLQE